MADVALDGIDPNRLYPLSDLKARLRWSDSAFRSAVHRGLVVIRDGKRAFVSGQAVVDWLEARHTSNSEGVCK